MHKEQPIRILVIDDNEEALYTLESTLTHKGFAVVTAENGKLGLARMRAEYPDLVLSDVVMPEMDGYEFVRQAKGDPLLRYVPIVLVTSKDSLDDITYGLEQGADDYICRPFQQEELLARVNAVVRTRRVYQELERSEHRNEQLQNQVAERAQFSELVGKSASMQQLYELIERVSASDVPVLITGESGTGKELVARAVHFNSPRKREAFVVQNVSAFSEHLLESELFGHTKGAFTGAHRDKEGLFSAAHGGTFFLDELGEMSPMLQAKLLRVLQDGTFNPVGSTSQKQVDVRVIAATNRDLEEMVEQGTFREDLYYRLNVVNLKLPPLRERKNDIPLLVDHYVQSRYELGTNLTKMLRRDSLSLLMSYDWPGNIRELQNEVERMLLMKGDAEMIKPDHLSEHIQARQLSNGVGSISKVMDFGAGTLRDATSELERYMIGVALERTGGNKSEAARQLGISRSSLISKAKSYRIG